MGIATTPGLDRLLSDERLTSHAVGGDNRAFAAIFRRYHQSLYRFCLTIVGNPEDAQDALQNTMTKVLRALPGEQRKIELKPWLYRIARNESIDLLRRRRETQVLDVEQIAPGHGLAEKAATRERLRSLLADLQELPERQREVLVMRELGGLGFEEIGTALATSGAVARQTLYEARQSLRQMEEGREMDCDLVTRALSDGDGRVVRRRVVRAHLRTCAGCRCFREEIERRERSFAALSPLPAMAAAGMLQGLLGGSQAATGGGLAAILGGGAAKTVGASAAAKGVATVAVVAAVGVGAADRTGVIHVGLPGEGPSKSSEASPATTETAFELDSAAGQEKVGAGAAVVRRAGGEPAGDPAAGQGSGSAEAETPVSRIERAPNAAAGRGLEHHPAHPVHPVDSGAPGPPVGRGAGQAKEEQQHPSAASPGQETGVAHVPSVPGPEADSDNGAPVDLPKAAPSSPSSDPHGKVPPEGKGPPPGKGPPAGTPASPQAAKPEPPPQAPPSSPQAEPPAKPTVPPGPPASPGKGAENRAEAAS